MAIFCVIFRVVFRASRVQLQHILDMHSKFLLRPQESRSEKYLIINSDIPADSKPVVTSFPLATLASEVTTLCQGRNNNRYYGRLMSNKYK